MPTDNEAYIHSKTGNLMLPKGRLLWSSLFKPRKNRGNDSPGKHECNLLFPKAAKLKVAHEEAITAGKDKFAKAFRDAGDKWPGGIATPFKRTADNEKLVAALEAADLKIEDWPVYIPARSVDKPGVVGPNGKSDGIEPEHVYPGRWARMSVQAFGYDTNGKKGVSFGLINVQLLDNDDELVIGGGRVSAESEFEAADGAGDDGKSSDDMFK